MLTDKTILEVFKDNYSKLKDVFLITSACEHTFMVEYYYKSKKELIGVDYFSFDEFSSEKLMKGIIDKYNNKVRSLKGGSEKVIYY